MMCPCLTRPQRGYSLTVVLLFLVLLFCLWAAVYRTTGALLRVQTTRVQRNDGDAGLLNAQAQALMYLEANSTLTRTPVSYGIKVPPNDPLGKDFTATFTPSPPPQWMDHPGGSRDLLDTSSLFLIEIRGIRAAFRDDSAQPTQSLKAARHGGRNEKRVFRTPAARQCRLPGGMEAEQVHASDRLPCHDSAL